MDHMQRCGSDWTALGRDTDLQEGLRVIFRKWVLGILWWAFPILGNEK